MEVLKIGREENVLRKLIAMLRSMLIGPSLNKLSRFTPNEIGSLSVLLSKDPVMKAIIAGGRGGLSLPFDRRVKGSQRESLDLTQIKLELASLHERLDVLERMTYSEKE